MSDDSNPAILNTNYAKGLFRPAEFFQSKFFFFSVIVSYAVCVFA